MIPVPKRRTDPELLDMPGQDAAELRGCLADIRKVNLFLGGMRAALSDFASVIEGSEKIRSPQSISVLDIGTGSADIPAELISWCRKKGIAIKVVAIDLNLTALRHAKASSAGPGISFAAADGLHLPFRDGSFDFVHCALTLHHFDTRDAAALIRGAARAGRHGIIIGDLRRSWIAWALILIITRLLTRNRLTRYDGPLSVLRSYTKEELEGLAHLAGLARFRVVKHPFWRMSLIGGAS